MAVTLKDEKLLDSWGVVMEGGAGRQDSLIQRTIQILFESQLPGVAWKLIEAQPGMIKGLFGKKRDYLMVTSEGLKDYRMYIGARDYGKHLDVSWFLTVEPGFFKSFYHDIAKNAPGLPILFGLDLFDQQDLRAYVTAVHRCAVRKAVEEIAKALGEDSSQFDWKSKGFLQVW